MMFQFKMHFLNKLYILFIILALNIFFFSTVKAQAKSFDINNIEISILLISKDFALIFSVEKKNIIKARIQKKIYKRLR